jgi:hypothetical protein
MAALEELNGLPRAISNSHLQEWKWGGGTIVGFTCGYVPEEVLHAAGILPYKTLETWMRDEHGAAKLLHDRILDGVGIPCLVVEADICDGRSYSVEGAKARIADFMGTLRI